ncbi:hypothetical protein EVAR_13800_1 [Eumeta japonica]|uniref:Uncharacterized protein n=1 Tax=Eumeta variegata TaxID=151549 RepID=A0A4C1U1V6_EUMVA|nr:hypothetical protein EVAR_13800_1 [Eumeta japonica]
MLVKLEMFYCCKTILLGALEETTYLLARRFSTFRAMEDEEFARAISDLENVSLGRRNMDLLKGSKRTRALSTRGGAARARRRPRG